MLIDYIGVKEINGSLIVLDDVEGASFEEMVEIRLEDGSIRHQRDLSEQHPHKAERAPYGVGSFP